MAATTTTRSDGLLAAVRDTASVITNAQVEQLVQAVQWAELHPGEDPRAYESSWAMRPLELAGEGAPTIDESAVAEFAFAVGMKHETGARFIADALELCHRLPRIWARVMSGEVPVWKARRLAQQTLNLPMDAAGAVDKHLAIIVKKCSFAEIERQVERARAEFDPAETERRRAAAAEQRHVRFHFGAMTSDGLVAFTGIADLADAVAFDALLTSKATEMDTELPLDVRRSMALGLIGSDDVQQREVVIYTHIRPDRSTVDVDNSGTVVTPEQVREWCQSAGTKVTVRPVIDLDEEMTSTAYEPPPLLREQIILRYRQCIFPDCERASRSCDLDHWIPFPIGPTSSWNLFPLCRTHHRFKTTGGWTYQPHADGTVEWTSPCARSTDDICADRDPARPARAGPESCSKVVLRPGPRVRGPQATLWQRRLAPPLG